eukprot:RCo042497
MEKVILPTPFEALYSYDPTADFLGKGRFGRVYRVTSVRGGEHFAAKAVPLTQDTPLDEILAEFHLLSHIRHENVVKFYGCHRSEDGGTLYGILELCGPAAGYRQLIPFITDRGSLREAEARELVRQLLGMLRYLHCVVHIAHRDLKPDNVLVTVDSLDDPAIKVVDFGCAKYFGHLPDVSHEELLGDASFSGSTTC